MKVLQVIPYFFVSWAGGRQGHPVETVYGLSEELAKRGHQVVLFTTDAFNKGSESEGDPSIIDFEGIKVHEFKSLGGNLGTKTHLIFAPAMVSALAKEVGNFDIIHLHEFRTLPNIFAHQYARRNNIPYVVQAHGSIPKLAKSRLKGVYDVFWGRRLLKDAAKVIAVTRREAEQYKNMGVKEDRIEIVPNAINLTDLANIPEKGKFKQKHGFRDEKLVLFLGRLTPVKGVDLLARAFARLLDEMKDARLVIVGSDEGCLADLKDLVWELKIEDRVLFPGALYGVEKLEAYVDAHVYVLPSVYEIFGITVLEALACGTPVIVSDKCGLAEKIDGRAGIVVPRDEVSLRDALRTLLTDEPVRKRFIDAGRKLVEAEFTWQKVAAKMESVYHSAIGAK